MQGKGIYDHTGTADSHQWMTELFGQQFGPGGVVEAVRELTRAGLELGFGDLDVSCLGAVVRSREND